MSNLPLARIYYKLIIPLSQCLKKNPYFLIVSNIFEHFSKVYPLYREKYRRHGLQKSTYLFRHKYSKLMTITNQNMLYYITWNRLSEILFYLKSKNFIESSTAENSIPKRQFLSYSILQCQIPSMLNRHQVWPITEKRPSQLCYSRF